jgi:hypothetical protein
MPYTSFEENANIEISQKTGVEYEELIILGIDYKIDGGDVLIENVYLQKGNVMGGQDITDCLSDADIEYLSQKILEEDGEWKL